MRCHGKWSIFRGGLVPASINQKKKRKDRQAHHRPGEPIDRRRRVPPLPHPTATGFGPDATRSGPASPLARCRVRPLAPCPAIAGSARRSPGSARGRAPRAMPRCRWGRCAVPPLLGPAIAGGCRAPARHVRPGPGAGTVPPGRNAASVAGSSPPLHRPSLREIEGGLDTAALSRGGDPPAHRLVWRALGRTPGRRRLWDRRSRSTAAAVGDEECGGCGR